MQCAMSFKICPVTVWACSGAECKPRAVGWGGLSLVSNIVTALSGNCHAATACRNLHDFSDAV